MNSEQVLSFFKEITTIPRESGHEEKIVAYLQEFAAKNNLECKTDDAGNVLIVKEAAPGFENVPTIVLQSHTDMVCEAKISSTTASLHTTTRPSRSSSTTTRYRNTMKSMVSAQSKRCSSASSR